MRHVPQALKFAIGSRIVVLVDDLDRCSPEQVLSVIEAIRLFLNADNFVFVLAMDCGVVTQAIGEHYKFMCQRPWERRDMGREYLDKIIQVPFHLPPLSGEALTKLAQKLIEPYSRKRPSIVRPDAEPQSAPQTGSQHLANGAVKSGAGDVEAKEPAAPIPPKRPLPGVPELHTAENEAIERFCGKAGPAMSPRLIKRFVNVYMIARNIYISGQKEHPPASFAYWIGLSVLYPSEASKCLTFFNQTTDDPLVLEVAGYRFVLKNETWLHLSPARVEAFKRLYAELEIDRFDVTQTKHITDCFNLALD